MNLIGQRFGRLTVIKEGERIKYKYPNNKIRYDQKWICNCDCGSSNIEVFESNLIKKNGTKSCGCITKERMRQLNKKQNKFDITSYNYGVGWTTNTNEKFYFDLEDYEIIKQHTWYREKNYNYIFTSFKIGNKTNKIKLHNYVMNFDISNKRYLKENIDHINGNPFDNRKNNLRIVTRSQNNMNRTITSNNTTGIRGISCRHKRNKNIWIVNFQSKAHSIKIYKEFSDKQKAIDFRKSLEEKYYGKYNRVN